MSYRIIIIGLCWLLACQAERSAPPETAEPSLHQIRLAFGERLADSTQRALSEALLAASLPQTFAPYTERTLDQAAFTGHFTQFSQSRATYRLAEGQYLAIKLADYARDSSAFIYLYRQYEQIEKAAPPVQEGRKVRLTQAHTFAWNWKDQQTGVQYLEAGVFGRFHVQIRTNRMSGMIALEDAFKRIAWAKLQQATEKNR